MGDRDERVWGVGDEAGLIPGQDCAVDCPAPEDGIQALRSGAATAPNAYERLPFEGTEALNLLQEEIDREDCVALAAGSCVVAVPVAGLHGRYEITRDGRVRSLLRGRDLARYLDPDGYYRVALSAADGTRSWPRVHRLVLESFVGPCPDGMQACHNNGVRADNRLENLRWGTHAENQRDRVLHGTSNDGSQAGNARLSEAAVVEMRRLRAEGWTFAALGRAFFVDETTARRAVLGLTWRFAPEMLRNPAEPATEPPRPVHSFAVPLPSTAPAAGDPRLDNGRGVEYAGSGDPGGDPVTRASMAAFVRANCSPELGAELDSAIQEGRQEDARLAMGDIIDAIADEYGPPIDIGPETEDWSGAFVFDVDVDQRLLDTTTSPPGDRPVNAQPAAAHATPASKAPSADAARAGRSPSEETTPLLGLFLMAVLAKSLTALISAFKLAFSLMGMIR